jgi:hypothetical protein
MVLEVIARSVQAEVGAELSSWRTDTKNQTSASANEVVKAD